jgi:hypothetical protein
MNIRYRNTVLCCDSGYSFIIICVYTQQDATYRNKIYKFFFLLTAVCQGLDVTAPRPPSNILSSGPHVALPSNASIIIISDVTFLEGSANEHSNGKWIEMTLEQLGRWWWPISERDPRPLIFKAPLKGPWHTLRTPVGRKGGGGFWKSFRLEP